MRRPRAGRWTGAVAVASVGFGALWVGANAAYADSPTVTSASSSPIPCLAPSSGGQNPTPNYGNGTPASAYAAYSQLPTAAAAAPVTASSGQLAFTGSNVVPDVLLGGGFLAVGCATVALSRIRRRSEDSPDALD